MTAKKKEMILFMQQRSVKADFVGVRPTNFV